jgi:dTDP-4-amino-4,6-dideoxygalactose transaminase
MMNLPTWPHFEADEISAVSNVLSSGKINYWTGEIGKKFEKEFANSFGCSYGIALANGTLALEAALQSLGIGPGDDVVVPCRTFIATASCVVARGARPIVADIDPISQTITAKNILEVLTPNTKAVIPVHLAGWPCEMDAILEVAKQYNLKVVEDCAQAIGAKYKGRYVGSFGDVAAFSFCQDKIITTGGEGGMLITNNSEIWRKAWAYKDHGKNPDKAFVRESSAGFRWLHESFGSNWRMTEMQSAIGTLQLQKLSKWLEIRKKNATIFTECFKNIPSLRVTIPFEEIEHAYYKYYVFIRPEMLKDGWNRDAILKEIINLGIPCGSGGCGELYLEKAFVNANLAPPDRFPVAKSLSETSLMLVVHPTLNEEHIHYMCDCIKSVMLKATKGT